MKKMTQEELNKILQEHKLWLESFHEKGKRAYLGSTCLEHLNLKGADLRYALLGWSNLKYADLSYANLTGAYLVGANLREAYLECVNLSDADLSHADLSNANLLCACLNDANLSFACLYNVNLIRANLINVVLVSADLSCAGLRHANLSGADLEGADLRSIDLESANLTGVHLDKEEQIRKGIIVKRKMIGYKKCRDGVIVKLEIPKGAVVFSINNEKCRTNIVKVIDVIGADKGISIHDYSFVYRKGKTLKVDNFDCQYNEECSTGIHFFRTLKDAREY